MIEGGSSGISWSLVFVAVLVAVYGYIIRVGIHHKPVFGVAKYSLRYWWHRLAHVTR